MGRSQLSPREQEQAEDGIMGASAMTDVLRDIAVQRQGRMHGYDGQRKEVPALTARTLGGTLHGWAGGAYSLRRGRTPR